MERFNTIDDLSNTKLIFNKIWIRYTDLGSIYTTFDIFVSTIINRAVYVGEAFYSLIKDKNLIAATPLIRLQSDNILYCFAAYLAEDFNQFLLAFLRGENWNKIQDRNGNELKESYLIEQLCQIYKSDMLSKAYKSASDFIHLSKKHLSFTLSENDLKQTIPVYNLPEHEQDTLELMLYLNNLLITIISDYWIPNREQESNILNGLRKQYPDRPIPELMQEYGFNNEDLKKQIFNQLNIR